MRLFIALALVFFILSCRNPKGKEQTFVKTVNKNPGVQADTFNFRDIDSEPSLQKGILLDTIDIPESKKHYGLSVIYPKLSTTEFPYASEWIRKVVDENREDFYETVNEEVASNDTSESDLR